MARNLNGFISLVEELEGSSIASLIAAVITLPRDVGESTEGLVVSVLDDSQSWTISVNNGVEIAVCPAILACLESFSQCCAFGEQVYE